MTAAETRQALHAAIQNHARQVSDVTEDALLSDWVIMTYWSSLDEQGDPYVLMTSDDPYNTHIVLGLLEVGRLMTTGNFTSE